MITRILFLIAVVSCLALAQPAAEPTTFCNPLNVGNNFQFSGAIREIGEPNMTYYNGDYYLTASWAGGYYWSPTLSKDLRDWTYVKCTGLNILPPIDAWAVTTWTFGGYLYFCADRMEGIWRTKDPKSGQPWEKCADNATGYDSHIFRGYDGNYYHSWMHDQFGQCDTTQREAFGSSIPSTHYMPPSPWGWGQSFLRIGYNTWTYDRTVCGVEEGGFILPYKGKYYWEWSFVGAAEGEYCEGVRIYDPKSPTGSPLPRPGTQYTFQNHNPVAFKPSGFVAGAGHGQFFADENGSCWKYSTAMLEAHDAGWERVLTMMPAYIDQDGVFFSDMALGDWPQYLPGKRPGGAPKAASENFAGLMLLSYRKPATASSTLAKSRWTQDHYGNPVTTKIENAFDESIQSWWSANTGDPGEWLRVDLQKICTIRAIQTAFAEEGNLNATQSELYHAYKIEASSDDQNWTTMIDKSANRKDVPYDYVELAQPVNARYVKITNVHMSAQGKFAICGFRVFGNANGTPPAPVTDFTINRNADKRLCTVSWQSSPGAFGYAVRFGIAPDKLYLDYEVLHGKHIQYPSAWIQYSCHDTTIAFSSLDTARQYYFRIDALSENGIVAGTVVKRDDNQMVAATIAGNKLLGGPAGRIQAFIRSGQLHVEGLSGGSVMIRIMDARGCTIASGNARSGAGTAAMLPIRGMIPAMGIRFIEVRSADEKNRIFKCKAVM